MSSRNLAGRRLDGPARRVAFQLSHLAQPRKGAMRPGLDGAHGHFQLGRDLHFGQAVVEAQHERCTLSDAQVAEGGLELRPREVHTLIAEGLGVIGRHRGMPEGKRLELIEQEQFLLVELRELVHEVEASARDHEPAEAWRGLRREIARLRERVKDLRDRYPRPRLPSV